MGEIRILKEEVYDEETGSIIDVIYLAGAPSNGGNGNGGEPSGLTPFSPTWRLQSGADPIIGNGVLYGEYAVDANGIADLFIHLGIGSSTALGVPGPTGTSRYYFKIPEFLAPKNPNHYGGSVQGWIGGAGQKEFTGVPFFYSGILNSIAVTLEGVAWGINHPKNLKLGGGSHLTFHSRYALKSP